MVVFPKQICKKFLPDTGESRSDKTFFLKTNMELEVCTSLGSMFHRRGALFVNEIRPANDAGWNGRKSPCCRPRVPCWCSWKWSFSRSNAGADCWWQRRMVVNSCRDQRCDRRVSFKFSISGRTSSWGWTSARHRTAFLHSAKSRSCWPVGMNGMVAEAAYSKSGWITETKNCLLAYIIQVIVHTNKNAECNAILWTILQVQRKKSWRKRESKTARQCINSTGNGWKLKTSNNAQRTKGRHCCGVHVRRPSEYHYVRRKLQTQVQKKKGPWSWFPEAMWIYPEAWQWKYRFFSRSQNGKGTVCRKRGRPETLCLSSRLCVTW